MSATPQSANSALDILSDIELPVTLRFGRRQMCLDQVLRLGAGSTIEFNRSAGDPVEVLVNDRVVAHGEAITVRGNYGVRITEIASPPERLDSAPGLRGTPLENGYALGMDS